MTGSDEETQANTGDDDTGDDDIGDNGDDDIGDDGDDDVTSPSDDTDDDDNPTDSPDGEEDPDLDVVEPNPAPGPNPEPASEPEPQADDDLPPDEPVPNPVPMCGGGAAVPRAPVCEDLCGNQLVDSCETCTGGIGGPPTPPPPINAPTGLDAQAIAMLPPNEPICTIHTEECDGSVDTRAGCESLGYQGGSLTCSDSCHFNTTACQSCGTDEHIVVCNDRIAVDEQPNVIALASNDEHIALALNSTGNGVRVVGFNESLEQIWSSECLRGTARALALATLPDGWVVAADDTLTVLAADGALRAERSIDGMTTPLLASRSGSTPLLVWAEPNATLAALLDTDGEEVWRTTLAGSSVGHEYGSAVAVSGGFLVATRLSDGGVHVLRLDETSGEVTADHLPGSSSTEYPQLAANGDTVRLTWADFSSTGKLLWATLDDQGQRLTEPVELGTIPDHFNRSPIAVSGTDTLVVFGGYTGGTGIGAEHTIRRLDAAGATVYGDYLLQHDPNSVAWPQLVAYQDHFVTAWLALGSEGRVGLTRLMP